MIKAVRSFINAYFGSLDYMRALGQVEKGRFEDADFHLRRAFKRVGVELPSEKASFDMNMLAAHVAIGLKDGPRALELAEFCYTQVLSDPALSVPDKNYLLSYCGAVVRYCLAWRDGGDPKGSISLHPRQLAGVKKRFLKQYPLPPGGSFW